MTVWEWLGVTIAVAFVIGVIVVLRMKPTVGK